MKNIKSIRNEYMQWKSYKPVLNKPFQQKIRNTTKKYYSNPFVSIFSSYLIKFISHFIVL